MKQKLVPDPYLASIEEWPHILEGTVDVVDGGYAEHLYPFENMSKADILMTFSAHAHLELVDGYKVMFRVGGSVLEPSMIWPDEFDQSAKFRISLVPIEDQGVPMAVDGKLVYLQDYNAVHIERVES